jgi:hypothetical protein
MKKIYSIIVSALILSACSTSNDFVSNKKIQKRKHNHGLAINNSKSKINFNNFFEKLASKTVQNEDLLSASSSNNLTYNNPVKIKPVKKQFNEFEFDFNSLKLTNDQNFSNLNSVSKSKGDEVKLRSGTMIELETTSTVSSKQVGMGQDVMFRVIRDVEVDDKVVIQSGSTAYGKVTNHTKAKGFGKPGELRIKVDRVVAVDGSQIYVSGDEISRTGKDKKGGAIAWLVVSLLILWIFIWVPFIIKGEEAIISSGTRSMARTNGTENIEVD